MLDDQEDALEVLKENIRKKQQQFLELIKQRVAIETLKERNINFLNNEVYDGSLSVTKAQEHQDKLNLPLLFVQLQEESSQVKVA